MNIVPLEEIPSKDKISDVPLDKIDEICHICEEMQKICIEHDGIGLSAVQVGIPWKLYVVKLRSGKFLQMVNCEYEPISENRMPSIEGCLSIKGKRYLVPRYTEIAVIGKVLEDKKAVDFFQKFDRFNIYCVVHQHEIDHLSAILISDIGKEVYI